jgi:hypothetical protein
MPILSRLVYSAYVLVGVSMVVALSVSIAEGLGARPSFDIQSLMFDPLYLFLIYLGCFAVAPALSAHLRISGDEPLRTPPARPPFGYAVRSFALVLGGLALSGLVALLIFLLEKFV